MAAAEYIYRFENFKKALGKIESNTVNKKTMVLKKLKCEAF